MTAALAAEAELASAPDEVREYCSAHQLTGYAQLAWRLARESFPPDSRVSFRVESDPESDARWLVVDMTVPEGADGLACYERFLDRWIAATPPHARDRIRLTFCAG